MLNDPDIVKLELTSILKKVRKSVMMATLSTQRPWVNDALTSSFYLKQPTKEEL